MNDLSVHPLPLYFRGLPYIYVPRFPPDWSGNLIILSGYGLGDTVNSLGIQKFFSRKYPQATITLFAHDNWKSILDFSSFKTVYYSEFWNIQDPSKLPAPHFPNIINDLKKIIKNYPDSYLGFGDIDLPTRFASGERHTESVLRILGIDNLDQVRPYIPLSQIVIDQAKKFLSLNKIYNSEFCVFAPEASYPDKEWGDENFIWLAEKIYESQKVVPIIVGRKNFSINQNKKIISATGIPLPIVCALISMSRCFVGNDSGLAHVAASFDIPILTINFERDILPYEIRPFSPYACQVISKEKLKKPDKQDVLNILQFLIKSNLSSMIPICFSCRRPMRIVMNDSPEERICMCFCGAQIRVGKKDMDIPIKEDCSEYEFNLPSLKTELKKFEVGIEEFSQSNKKIQIIIDKKIMNCYSFNLIKENEEIHWEFDSILFYFEKNGYYLSSIKNNNSNKFVLIFEKKIKKFAPIIIMWGSRRLFVINCYIYLKYFSFKSWSLRKKMIDILKGDWEYNSWSECFWVGLSVFLYYPSFKSFLRWQRIYLKLILKKYY